MKFKVYTQTKIEPKDQVHFRLFEGKESVVLTAVNEDGSDIAGGNILSIDSKGLHPFSNINKHLGLTLNEKGYMKIETL